MSASAVPDTPKGSERVQATPKRSNKKKENKGRLKHYFNVKHDIPTPPVANTYARSSPETEAQSKGKTDDNKVAPFKANFDMVGEKVREKGERKKGKATKKMEET